MALSDDRELSSAYCYYLDFTRGLKGVMLTDRKAGKVHNVPALSTNVIDRIGAGDAFLALAGLCIGGGLAPEVAAFVGSVSAALDVATINQGRPGFDDTGAWLKRIAEVPGEASVEAGDPRYGTALQQTSVRQE